ncbi:MAG: tripartite tricarboxylate transporter substrate-binding protein [Desulfobacterales bacterium]|nr:tripartite tricarboxylate transporter substrate-binding protein [Desulfobacterales bacterium]
MLIPGMSQTKEKKNEKSIRYGRLAIGVLLFASVFFLFGVSAQAQGYPNKPIELVVASAAGGQADLMSRVFTPYAQEAFGQPLIIQVRPGGEARSAPNWFIRPSRTATPSLVESQLERHPAGAGGRSRGPEMDAVCRINSAYVIYFVQDTSPFKTFKDVISYAKANLGTLSFGTAGVWSMIDLEWRWIQMKAGIQTRIVQYSGGGASLLGLLGGHVQVAPFSMGSALSHYKAGKLWPLAISAPKRHVDLPNVLP